MSAVGEGQKWLLKHVPFYAQWYRFWLFWMLTDGIYPMVQADPGLERPPDSVSARQRYAARNADAYI